MFTTTANVINIFRFANILMFLADVEQINNLIRLWAYEGMSHTIIPILIIGWITVCRMCKIVKDVYIFTKIQIITELIIAFTPIILTIAMGFARLFHFDCKFSFAVYLYIWLWNIKSNALAQQG